MGNSRVTPLSLDHCRGLCCGMRKANIIRGKILSHGEGVGTTDEQMVQERAREIAITNGRQAHEVNKADLEQAREELMGVQNAPVNEPDADEDESAHVLIPRGDPLGSEGEAAPTKRATDEQSFPEQLAYEGVEEAAHDRMVEGNKESLRRDSTYSDQLPGSDTE
jgi:hypothetical protein